MKGRHSEDMPCPLKLSLGFKDRQSPCSLPAPSRISAPSEKGGQNAHMSYISPTALCPSRHSVAPACRVESSWGTGMGHLACGLPAVETRACMFVFRGACKKKLTPYRSTQPAPVSQGSQRQEAGFELFLFSLKLRLLPLRAKDPCACTEGFTSCDERKPPPQNTRRPASKMHKRTLGSGPTRFRNFQRRTSKAPAQHQGSG